MTTTSKYTKTNLQSILSAGPVEIKFTKKDGTERTMLATTNPSLIPATTPSSSKSKKQSPDNVLKVWSIVDAGYRSIIVENIIHVIQ